MYTPAFFEVFVGLLVVVLWAWVLGGVPSAPRGTRAIPWIVTTGVVVGQLLASIAVLQASAGATETTGAFVEAGRWGSVAAVVGGAIALALLSAMAWLHRRSTPDP